MIHCDLCEREFTSDTKHRDFIFSSKRWPASADDFARDHGYVDVRTGGFLDPWRVAPPPVHGFSGGVHMLKSPPAFELYTFSRLHWLHLVDRGFWPPREPSKLLPHLEEPVKKWMHRICLDSEAGDIFLMLTESLGGYAYVYDNELVLEDLLTRVADLYDLPKYWLWFS